MARERGEQADALRRTAGGESRRDLIDDMPQDGGGGRAGRCCVVRCILVLRVLAGRELSLHQRDRQQLQPFDGVTVTAPSRIAQPRENVGTRAVPRRRRVAVQRIEAQFEVGGQRAGQRRIRALTVAARNADQRNQQVAK